MITNVFGFKKEFDDTLGFPGEGPKMPNELVEWYKNNFTDDQVEEIARSIVESGCSYNHACLQSGYNMINGQYAQSDNRVYFRLRKAVCKLRKKKKIQKNERTLQLLKDANGLNETTAKKVISIEQERDNLIAR